MRGRVGRLVLAAGVIGALVLPVTAAPAASAAPVRQSAGTDPIPVSLGGHLDNDGIGTSPGQADFDGSTYSFPADQVPATGTVTLGGVAYDFPPTAGDDNMIALGQDVAVPQGHYLGAYLLGASSYGPAGGTATVHYADGGTTQVPVSAPDWYSGGTGVINASHRFSPTETDAHPVSIFPISLWMDPAREATSITLPTTAKPVAGTASMHVFALSLQPAVPGYAVRVSDAASTTKTMSAPGGRQVQVVQATVQNLGDQWLRPGHTATVTVEAAGVRTVVPATLGWLAPGDAQRVEIGIQASSPMTPGTPVAGKVVARVGGDTS
ncbi:MAG TPA: hypothetical protein VE198_19320, partial [Actinoallomurus sp.]|nr:hypothetical protein [Actinoallomurus sp.]